MYSDQIKQGVERAPHRSLLRALGVKPEDLDKPFIGVCNSFNEIIPGHMHLNVVGRLVCRQIRKAGGIPFEFNTIGICDGIAMGHMGMKYSLPSRELIADSVESMVRAHCFDALVCITNCDKIVPGMLMGALRVNVPTIMVSGGRWRGRLPEGKPSIWSAFLRAWRPAAVGPSARSSWKPSRRMPARDAVPVRACLPPTP